MKSLLSSLFLCLFVAALNAQTLPETETAPCGVRAVVPPVPESELPPQDMVNTPESVVKTIPVVFHVLHQSGIENVSREDLLGILQRLNQDFKKLNPNLSSSPEVFKNQAVDMEVEFKFATIDPDGNCTDGINRIYTPLANFNQYETPPVEWPTNKYLNVYIVRSLYQPASTTTSGLPNGLLGCASFPSPSSNFFSTWDGIFISYGITNVVSQASNPLFQNNFSVLAHETGHWLNLLHIWGNEGFDQCFESDYVSDTPPQSGPSRKCPDDFPYITCDNGPNGNMFCNFMDYGNCVTMFTTGQKNRVATALNGPYRNVHWATPNLMATGVAASSPNFSCPTPPKADFAFQHLFLIPCEPNLAIALEERCFSAKPSSIEWFFPGGTPAYSTDFDVTVTYPTGGDHQITMVAKNAYGADTLVRTLHLQAIPSIAYPAGGTGETFESANSVADVGGVYHREGDLDFNLCTTSGFNSNHSLYLPKKSGDLVAWFITRKFTVTAEDTILYFQAARSSGGTSRLQVGAEIGCYPLYSPSTLLGGFNEDVLNTAPFTNTEFFPSGEAQWKSYSLVIPDSLRGRDDVQFYFLYRSGETNNFFIDDIRVGSQPATAVATPTTGRMFELFPNPASDRLGYRFDQPVSGSTLIITDVCGRVRLRETPGAAISGTIELNGLQPGVYWCRLLDEQGRSLGQPQKVIVL
ncbi:MAG: PKD domain-containing protein [Saprospiraceae bacterium]|nr:PKD domain-containing protein [Saprospiraceae bacterium]